MRISDWCADVCSSYLPKWLRGLGADPRALSIIRVAGDSMAPTLSDGDDILVDGGDAAGRLRDGLYVLRMDDALMVKRIARAPGPGRIAGVGRASCRERSVRHVRSRVAPFHSKKTPRA